MRFVQCDADGHPGDHLETKACVRPERETLGHRIFRAIENRLTTKRGDPSRPRCAACRNPLIGDWRRCCYCGEATGRTVP